VICSRQVFSESSSVVNLKLYLILLQDLKKIVGAGANGIVDLVREKKRNGRTMVRKVLLKKSEHFNTRECLPFFLRHENIVRFFGCTEMSGYYGVLLEYMEGGSLEKSMLLPILNLSKALTIHFLFEFILKQFSKAQKSEILKSIPYDEFYPGTFSPPKRWIICILINLASFIVMSSQQIWY